MKPTPKMVKTAPESVYLIVDPNGYSCMMSDEFPRDTGEVSWCEDSCSGVEVKYVRDDLSQNTQSWAAAFQAKDRCEQQDARIAELTAEVAKLRKAMGVVERMSLYHSPDPTADMLHIAYFARNALKESGL